MEEIWKPMPEFPDYHVSNHGRIMSFKTGLPRILNCGIDLWGYRTVGFSHEGRTTRMFVHQAVAITFLNHTRQGSAIVVDHIDADKLNNCADNLQLVTNLYNIQKGYVDRGIRTILL